MTQRIGTKITNRILAYLNKDNKRKHSEKLDCTQYMKQQDGMHCGIHVCWNAYQLGYLKVAEVWDNSKSNKENTKNAIKHIYYHKMLSLVESLLTKMPVVAKK